ncbi:MAG: hypothetical protein FWF34_01100 [Alphaproteobacteria bacterium]|nr:hypothetical protein [Alphaproteobacteria bacterium]MCL2889840.1 hypothetical protein [Alphaproteobacteria bacterium]
MKKNDTDFEGNPIAITEWNGSDAKNLAEIEQAFLDRRIDADTRDYMLRLYSDGMKHFREVFYVLGKYLSAPKAPAYKYDPHTGDMSDAPIKIIDINPGQTYLVQHRLDGDPMRNQFFQFDSANNVKLSVSSIVTVIIGSQKKVVRAMDKITTGRYYGKYVDEVVDAATRVISMRSSDASANAIADKIRNAFAEKYTTNAAEEVLKIIGRGHEKIAVELVRELDKIVRPQHRLRDVYRIKCLFDVLPQVRKFINGIISAMPDKVIEVRDKFYDVTSSRNYRDAKIILNIGTPDAPVPMEIICQIRTFLDFERQTHGRYETLRHLKPGEKSDAEIIEHHEQGIHQYNTMICGYVGELFERVGWNVLYNHDLVGIESLLDGFPKLDLRSYPPELLDMVMKKIETNVKNEVFRIIGSPRKLSQLEEIQVLEYMTRFIMSSAIPYMLGNRKISGNDTEHKLFNFVMSELYRYQKNNVLG